MIIDRMDINALLAGADTLVTVGVIQSSHCTGSSSTQSGLLAGFAALGVGTKVIGISDDGEHEIKRKRGLRLATDTLDGFGVDRRISPSDVHIEIADDQPQLGPAMFLRVTSAKRRARN